MYLDVSDRDRYVTWEICLGNQKLDMKLPALRVDKLGGQGLTKLSHLEVLVTTHWQNTQITSICTVLATVTVD